MNDAKYAFILLLLPVVLFPLNLAAQIPKSMNELLYGTWVLDQDRSTFFERQAPRNQTLIYEPHEEGLQATVIFIEQDGTENRTSYVASQDGVPVRLRGSEDFDTIILESRGPYQANTTFTHAGLVVGQAERTISMDGKEMRVVVKRKGNLSSRAVFVKQEEQE